jgi:hypothetical protein
VGVVFLARFAVARPLRAAVVNLKVVKMPQGDPRHVFVAKSNVNIT